MKCAACKYENNAGEWNNEMLRLNPKEQEKEDFIRIRGNHTIDTDWGENKEEVQLFACPICFTVQLKRRW